MSYQGWDAIWDAMPDGLTRKQGDDIRTNLRESGWVLVRKQDMEALTECARDDAEGDGTYIGSADRYAAVEMALANWEKDREAWEVDPA